MTGPTGGRRQTGLCDAIDLDMSSTITDMP